MKLKIFQNNSLIEFLQGHKIKNSSGTALTQRGSIKFTGSATVTDDSTNDQTIVNITGGGSGGHTILNSSGTAMTARSKLQFVGATVTDDSANDKTIVTTTPQSMIGDAWIVPHAYAVGDYCIDGNVLYKCKQAHTSSASYRPPYASYWDAVSVTSQLGGGSDQWEDITSNFTLNPNVSWISANCWFKRNGKYVVFNLRGTFPSSVGTAFNLVTAGIQSSGADAYFPIFSTTWSSPSLLAVCAPNNVTHALEIAGPVPSGIASKGFVVTGWFIEK